VLVVLLLALVASGIVPLAAPWLASPADAAPVNTTFRVSLADGGAQSTGGDSGNYSVSADGRYVAFESLATNLTGISDTNGVADVFVRDRVGGKTELISISTTGGVGNGESRDPSISADGRYISFTSTAGNLVAGDTNNTYDVFVRDRLLGTTQRVSVDSSGVQGSAQAGFGSRITPDGHYVVFADDSALVTPDSNGTTDVFIRDLVGGTIQRVSVSTLGAEGNAGSGWPSVSADGRYVAWYSAASTLLDGGVDTNANYDVFVRDRTAGTTIRASVSSSGVQAVGGSVLPSLSADGRHVVFYSNDPLGTGDGNGISDVFVRDLDTPATTRISVGTGGADGNGVSIDPNISTDGRYIMYSSVATNLITGDTNSQQDVFLYDRLITTTERISIGSGGTQGTGGSYGRAAISADGRFVPFISLAANFDANDSNGNADIFVRERAPQQAPLPDGAVAPAMRWGGGSASTLVDCPAPNVDPCDVSTGNFFDTTTDLSIPGRGMNLDFTRTFNAYPSPAAPADGPLGYGWSFTYGMSLTTGTNPTVTEENGAQITFTGTGPYTAPARVIATLLHNGDGTWTFTRQAREVFTFNSSGQLTAAKDLNGNGTTLAYVSGKLSTITDGAGRTLTIGWNGTHIATVTDTASPARSVSFTYVSSNLTEAVDVGAGHTQYTYDASHRMKTKREPKYFGDTITSPSPVTTINYDGSGRMTSLTDPVGRTTTIDYTSAPTSITITDAKGNVRVDGFTYGLLTSRTLGSGTSVAATWTYAYDPATLGRTSTIDPNGDAITTVYESTGSGLPSMTIDQIGRPTVRTFNDLLRVPLTATDPMGVTTTYGYDSHANLTSETTPLVGSIPPVSKATGYSIDNTAGRVGDVLSVTDPDGKVWSKTWDSYGNLSTESDPITPTHDVTTYCYDTVGRATRVISPKGTAAGITCATSNPTYTTLITTDAFGDEISVTDANGHTTQTAYDLNRNKASTTDALGAITTYTYDPANQLIEQSNPWSILLRDDFTGTSGSWNTALWGTTSGVTLSGNQGTLASAATPARATAKTMADTLDSEATFTYQFSATGNSTLRAALRASGGDKSTGADMPNAYRLEINPSTATLQLTKVVAGTVSNLGSSVAYTSGTTAQRVRFQVQGSTIRAKVWAANSSEPSTWTVERSDTAVTAAGTMQFSNLLVSGTTQNANIDDLHVLDAATPQGAAWTSPVRVADNYTGTSGAWNADQWAVSSGVVLSGNQGTMPATSVSVRATARAMPDVMDSEANFTYSLNSVTSPTSFRISLRSSGASKTTSNQMTTGYRLEITPSSTAVHIKKIVNSTVTDLGQFTYTQVLNTPQRVRFQVQGSTIRAKIWALGASEPSTWLLSVTDTEITTPGVLQLANSFTSPGDTVTVDDLSVMLGNTLRWDYNADGTLNHAYDGAGQPTTYGYDAQARLTTVTDPYPHTTTYGYDPAGNRVTKADPGGTGCPAWPITYPPTLSPTQQCTVSRYDGANQLTGVYYSDGTTPNVTAMVYDLDGRRTNMTDGTGMSSWVYDSLSRLKSNKNGAGTTISYGYDLRGNRTSIAYPAGTVTQTFDNAGRMTTVADWLSHQTTFNYDADSFMTSQVYPAGTGMTATYSPDNTDQVKQVHHTFGAGSTPTSADFTYTRDNNDRLASVTSTGIGDTRNWTYSANGQLKTDNGALYATDDANNLIRQTSGTVQGYDAADEMSSSGTISVVGATGAGDSTSTPQTLTLPPGTTTGDLMVIAVTVPFGQTPTVTGSGTFTLVGTYSAGTTASVVFYRRKVAAGETNPTVSFGGLAYGKAINMVVYRGVDGTTPIDGTPGPVGQTATQTVTVPSITPSVSGDRLVLIQGAIPTSPPGTWSVPGGTTPEGPQQQPANGTAAGLISDQSLLSTAGSGPRPINLSTNGALVGVAIALKPSQTTYGYADSRGNRTSITPAGGSTTTLTYDQANRLTSYGTTGTYTYDGDGTRMSKTVSGTATPFTWDDSGSILAEGSTNFIYDPLGLPLEKISAGVVSYYHHDQDGSTRALTNSSGNVIATATYDRLGNTTASSGATTTFGYLGEYQDAETGFLFGPSGYYDPVTGSPLGRTAGESSGPISPEQTCRAGDVAPSGYHLNAANQPPGQNPNQSCNDAQFANENGKMTIQYQGPYRDKKGDWHRFAWEFRLTLFPPARNAPSADYFAYLHYPGAKTETFHKPAKSGSYIFHGKFDNRYGKKGRNTYQGGTEIQLDFKVNLYDQFGNDEGVVRGRIRCRV
jgi:YD repeat-containing protein